METGVEKARLLLICAISEEERVGKIYLQRNRLNCLKRLSSCAVYKRPTVILQDGQCLIHLSFTAFRAVRMRFLGLPTFYSIAVLGKLIALREKCLV